MMEKQSEKVAVSAELQQQFEELLSDSTLSEEAKLVLSQEILKIIFSSYEQA